MSRSGGRSLMKTLFGALVFVSLLWVLLIGKLASSSGRKTATMITPSIGSFRQYLKEVEGERTSFVRPDLDPNYMSKRRVPNGPDPIHNRGAGKSKRPPGRA